MMKRNSSAHRILLFKLYLNRNPTPLPENGNECLEIMIGPKVKREWESYSYCMEEDSTYTVQCQTRADFTAQGAVELHIKPLCTGIYSSSLYSIVTVAYIYPSDLLDVIRFVPKGTTCALAVFLCT